MWRLSEVAEMQQSPPSRRAFVATLVTYLAAVTVLMSAAARLSSDTSVGVFFITALGVLAVALWAPQALVALVHNQRLPDDPAGSPDPGGPGPAGPR